MVSGGCGGNEVKDVAAREERDATGYLVKKRTTARREACQFHESLRARRTNVDVRLLMRWRLTTLKMKTTARERTMTGSLFPVRCRRRRCRGRRGRRRGRGMGKRVVRETESQQARPRTTPASTSTPFQPLPASPRRSSAAPPAPRLTARTTTPRPLRLADRLRAQPDVHLETGRLVRVQLHHRARAPAVPCRPRRMGHVVLLAVERSGASPVQSGPVTRVGGGSTQGLARAVSGETRARGPQGNAPHLHLRALCAGDAGGRSAGARRVCHQSERTVMGAGDGEDEGRPA